MPKKFDRSEAFGVALKMELEGIKFYTKAASKAADSLGRQMFLSLVEDEKRHAEIFRKMAEEEGVVAAEDLDPKGPVARMSAVFKAAAKRAKTASRGSPGDIKAIDVALGMEQEAYVLYTDLARTCQDAREKHILQKIAEEENQHFKILNDTRLYLTYPQMWHIIQEKPVIDGG